MKFKSLAITTILIIFSLTSTQNLSAESWPRTGIGLKGCYWDFVNESNGISISNYWGSTEVTVSGYGGGIFLLSQTNRHIFLEFTLGAVSSVENYTAYGLNESTGTISIIEILFGGRYILFPQEVQTNVLPYVSFGGGAYLINDTFVRQNNFPYEQEVSIETTMKPGGYLGCGFLFLFTKSFGLNFDLRYQFVDFQREDLQSGFEFGIGCVVMWGGPK
jgi:hypothetical protein